MFSGITNQMSSWMGAAKGDEAFPGGETQQPELQAGDTAAVDQAQAAFENVPVSEGGDEDAKASRYGLSWIFHILDWFERLRPALLEKKIAQKI